MPIEIVLMLVAQVIDRDHCSPECDGMTYCGICKLYGPLMLNKETNHYFRDAMCIKNTGKPRNKKTGLMLDPYTKEPLKKQPRKLEEAPTPETKAAWPSPNCTPGCTGIGNRVYCGLQRRTRHCVILLPEQKPEKTSPLCPDDCPGVKNPLDCHSIKSCYKCKPVKKKKPVLQKISAKCKATCKGVKDKATCHNMRESHNCPVPSLRTKYACVNCGAPVTVTSAGGKCVMCGKNAKLKKK